MDLFRRQKRGESVKSLVDHFGVGKNPNLQHREMEKEEFSTSRILLSKKTNFRYGD